MTVWDTIERGEYVMFALAALLLLAVAILWVRCMTMRKIDRSYPGLMQRLRDHVTEGDIENARQICEISDTPGSKVLCAGIGRIGHPLPEVKTAMGECGDYECRRFSKGIIWLRMIAVISPLLGLGGTLVGIIDRLRDLGGITEGVDISMVCAYLAPTIVTTVAGLVVGILALVALTCLDSRIMASRRKMEQLQHEFLDLLNEPS